MNTDNKKTNNLTKNKQEKEEIRMTQPTRMRKQISLDIKFAII